MRLENRPITLFGIPLKGIITCLFFMVTLLVVFDPLQFKSMIRGQNFLNIDTQNNEGNSPVPSTDIVATSEMIVEAISDIRTKKIGDFEQTTDIAPVDRFFYIVELNNGGDIEASDVTIEPEMVTVISASGIKTVIPRTTVKDIRRYKLPDPEPAQ